MEGYSCSNYSKSPMNIATYPHMLLSVRENTIPFLTRSHQTASHSLTSQSLISSRLHQMSSRWSTLHNSNALGNAFNQPNAHAHFPETAGCSALINITTNGKKNIQE